MPQSLTDVLLHVIFSTKNREPFLHDEEFRKEVHAYLAVTLESIDCAGHRGGHCGPCSRPLPAWRQRRSPALSRA